MIFKFFHFLLMCFPNLVELIIIRIEILFVLGLESIHRLEELDFRLSLNEENFVLESFDVCLESVLYGFVVLHELFVSSNDKLDLRIFG